MNNLSHTTRQASDSWTSNHQSSICTVLILNNSADRGPFGLYKGGIFFSMVKRVQLLQPPNDSITPHHRLSSIGRLVFVIPTSMVYFRRD
jgi:hypothetical protein